MILQRRLRASASAARRVQRTAPLQPAPATALHHGCLRGCLRAAPRSHQGLPRRPLQAPAWLLAVPGASRTVLEVRVPYSTGSLTEVLGHEPVQYASQETAMEMAKAAYRHAANLSPFGADIVGVGCTCALATDRFKKGEHRVSPSRVVVLSL